MTIGIIGAMDKEIENILTDMQVITNKMAMGLNFYIGTLPGSSNSVILVKSGIGKVNAALCAQILIDLFAVDQIINVGIAGGMADGMKVGDIAISAEAMYHDFDTSALGDEPGEISGMDTSVFKADAELVRIAKESVEEINYPCYVGRVVSGDQFIGDDSVKNNIKKMFAPVCCEMEGAAIAHACYLNKIPFVIIRAISDNADGSGDVDYESFSTSSALVAAKIVKTMISRI